MRKSAFLAIGLSLILATTASANPARPADNAAYSQIVPKAILVSADMRDGVSLSGPWHYSVDPYKDGMADFLGKAFDVTKGRGADINVEAATKANPNALYEYDLARAPVGPVPSAWIGYDPSLRYYNGLMWYQKSFERPQAVAGKRIFLRFGAADYKSMIFLNGHRVGEHEGGSTPFSFDVTDILRDHDNNLVVGVDSSRSADSVPTTVTDWETYGGITRDVRLVITPQTYVDDSFIRLGKDGLIHADIALEGASKANHAVSVSIPALKVNMGGTTDADGRLSLNLKAPQGLKRWSPETPTLYDVAVKTDTDTLNDRIGFRTIEVQGDKIILNGKPVFLRGISLHEEELGANPVRNMTEASSRALLNEIKTGLHGNFVRLAHYPHSEVTTRLADEIGLLVWSEIPVYWSIDFKNPDTLALAQKMMAENILRDRNRAAIIIWSVGNETPVSDARTSFLTTLAHEARDLDGTRLVSAALLTGRKVVDGHIDITIDDPLVPELDVMGINTYNGWYGSDNLAEVSKTVWHSAFTKPMIFSELGAGAQYGVHDPITKKRFSEDYQADYYRSTLAMADKVPFLAGLSPWILKDFRSPRRQNTYQNGWNRKGLMSETGQHKMAFSVLADYYAKKAAENSDQ
ncbi:MAG: glycoside hydrolase family 2 TIM barrel-domain containing protein [Asticcacaulis sp.]